MRPGIKEVKKSNVASDMLNNIKDTTNEKNKQISAKVNKEAYDDFTKINKARGLSNNSAINMLITEYVKDNKDFID